MIKRIILRLFYKLIGMTPDKMPMVQYWKYKDSCAAKITKAKDGSTVMQLEGEKYPFPTFPRGHLLLGNKPGEYPLFSQLKHQIKNKVFNDSWEMLQNGESEEEIVRHIKSKLFGDIAGIAEGLKYDAIPPERMCPSVREIYRSWSKIAPKTTFPLRDYICFILQEDDAYRMRFQWLVKWFDFVKINPVKAFEKALRMCEEAEVIGDMKERIKLLRTILMVALKDEHIRTLFVSLFREIKWRKIALTKGDAYHFRGKYFKVDYDVLEY
jgi:hypothetical protein